MRNFRQFEIRPVAIIVSLTLCAFAAAAAPQVINAQDTAVPLGRLVFRASSLEFRPDGTFLAHTVVEGIGEVRAAGTWKAQTGTIELADYELLAGAELLAGFPSEGCRAAGQYRFERSGKQVRLSVLHDPCVRRSIFLDKTRWAPPGEPNLAPPRTLTRTMFDAGVRLPLLEDGSGSWPSFRGPHASGIADGQPFPERWNIQTGENVLWRTGIPGLAHSSPILWGNRLFVTSAISSRGDATFKTGAYDGGDASDDTSSQRWVVYALNAATGRILWEQTAYEGKPRDKRHVKSTYASSTPATDGRVVVAWFGSQGLYAYTVEGKPLWSVNVDRLSVGAAESAEIEWGPASSPVIWNGLVFLQVDTRDDSFVVALSAETGDQVWKTEREEPPSWSTPTIVTTRHGAELVVNGSNFVRGYDPRTGQERWRVASASPLPTPTPVKAGELSIVTSGGLGSARPIVAVRHGASGDLTRDPAAGTTNAPPGLAWRVTGRGPGTPTPLAYQGILYVLANNGVLDAYDVETGTELFRARVPDLGSGFSASPVAADGKIFLANEDGAIAVVAAGRTFRHLATNEIDEPVMATPALSRGVIFVRGKNSIFAIGRQAAQTPRASRPNIIYIMTDDHAAHAIGAYGSRVNKTPHLDRMAREGALLTSVFATNAICTPSRATILTGQYSHINGVTMFNRFDSSRMTVARLLQEGGYYTGMMGKWHLGSDPVGFDRWEILPGQGAYRDPVFYTATGEKTYTGQYATDVITDLALEFIQSRPRGKPFFLMMHHKAPHRPWEPSDAHAAHFAGQRIPEPVTFWDSYATRTDALRENQQRVAADLTNRDLKLAPPPGLGAEDLAKWRSIKPDAVTIVRDGKSVTLTGEALVRWKYQRYMQDYLATVQSVDDSVGRVLALLDKTGLARNTMVVYTSDQGFFLGDHGLFDKRFMYEESIRMPFLVRWPASIKPGTRSDALALNVDFAPTFLQTARLPVSAGMQGRSLLPVLGGRTPADWRTSMYYRYYHDPGDHNTRAHYGVRTRTHKLIYFWKKDQWELFDLANDPHELHNLYGQPGQEGLTVTLKQELGRLKREVRDTDQLANEQLPNGVDGPVARLRGR